MTVDMSPVRFGAIYKMGPNAAKAFYDALSDTSGTNDQWKAGMKAATEKLTGETDAHKDFLSVPSEPDDKNHFSYYLLTHGNGHDDVTEFRAFNKSLNQVKTPSQVLTLYLQKYASRINVLG